VNSSPRWHTGIAGVVANQGGKGWRVDFGSSAISSPAITKGKPMRLFTIFLTAALMSTPVLASSTRIPDPEVLLCPARYGDLEYGIYRMMTDAHFQQNAGPMNWRRRFAGPFHLLSLESANYLHVSFDTFRTSTGTRLIAKPRWRTTTYEFGVQNKAVVDIFQEAIDVLRSEFPCP
jgi:hypothetical protein